MGAGAAGRTAQALQRSGWTGRYIGADIVSEFVAELKRKCPGYEAHVNRRPTIVASDASVDMVFHWSVFTHLSPEECYLYLEDCFRALKPGGTLVFSFLEMTNEEHFTATFESRLRRLRRGKSLHLPDTFLHPDWIRVWADNIGFSEPRFTHGQDASDHPPAWQTVAVMMKPPGQSSSS